MKVSDEYLLMIVIFVGASLYLINCTKKMKNVYDTAPPVTHTTYHT